MYLINLPNYILLFFGYYCNIAFVRLSAKSSAGTFNGSANTGGRLYYRKGSGGLYLGRTNCLYFLTSSDNVSLALKFLTLTD